MKLDLGGATAAVRACRVAGSTCRAAARIGPLLWALPTTACCCCCTSGSGAVADCVPWDAVGAQLRGVAPINEQAATLSIAFELVSNIWVRSRGGFPSWARRPPGTNHCGVVDRYS